MTNIRTLSSVDGWKKLGPIGQPNVCTRNPTHHALFRVSCITTDGAEFTSHAPFLLRPFHIVSFLCGHFEPRLPASRRHARIIALVRAVRMKGHGVGQRCDPFAILYKNVSEKRLMLQEHTTVATNELEAPFVREDRVVKLVRFLGTQTVHSFISLARHSLWPIVDGIPLLFQLSFERGPWEPVFWYSETYLTCVHDGQSRVVGAMKWLTKHGDEFLLDSIDLAGLFRVPVACGTKYRGRGLDLRGVPEVKVSFERIYRSQLLYFKHD